MKKKPIRVYKKDWGCCKSGVQEFVDEHFKKGQNYLEVTEENIWLFITKCDPLNGNQKQFGIWLICRNHGDNTDLGGGRIGGKNSNQSILEGIREDKETKDVQALSAILYLQAQGVF